MKFEELPESVQVIAANLLADKLKESFSFDEESAKEIADPIKAGFTELYNDKAPETQCIPVVEVITA
ncbi:TPA: hypothetical protein QH023_003741 [Morganella morganii subsp. morganii]|nr:hypothetical protein [Morganella morganii subsp. morganii]HDU8581335.1 hypothetical protein [Morganella morganii]